MKKTKVITDSEGTRFTIDLNTREILSTIDKHGFTYNKQGKRTGNIHGHEYIEGNFYD